MGPQPERPEDEPSPELVTVDGASLVSTPPNSYLTDWYPSFTTPGIEVDNR